MQASYVHSLTTEELEKKIGELKKELFNLRLSLSSGQLTNPMTLVTCKKDIARVKTVLREREISSRKQA
ncbi:MAG: 50S ribosomal protein L29 [Clostridia bacterium]